MQAPARHRQLKRLGVLAALATLVSCTRASPTAEPPAPSPPGADASPAFFARQGYTRPPLVDFHGHLSLDGVERIEAIFADVGIGAMINLSGGSGRDGGRSWLLSKVLSDRLGGRIINFVNIDWQECCNAAWGAREAAAIELAVRRYGFGGVKISKALGLGVRDTTGTIVAVDDRRLAPIWDAAGALGIPVSIHVADPRAFWQPPDARNERYAELSVHPGWSWYQRGLPEWAELLDAAERLYAAHPRTTFVAVHFGNAAEDLQRVGAMLDRLPNVWVDLAARVGEIGRHPAAEVRALIVRHADRVLFGTDIGVGFDGLMLGSNGAVEPTMADVAPFYDAHFRFLEGDARQIAHPSPIQGAWKVDAIALPSDVLDKVYRDNARRLLKRPSMASSPSPRPPARP